MEFNQTNVTFDLKANGGMLPQWKPESEDPRYFLHDVQNRWEILLLNTKNHIIKIKIKMTFWPGIYDVSG